MFRVRARGQLLRILGVRFGIAVALGNMIGAGILRAPAAIAATVPDGRLILMLWIIGGLHVLLSINILSELGTAIPQSGGPYLYAHRAFGDIAGLVVGWSQWMSKLAGIASTSIACAEFLPIVIPDAVHYTLPVALGVQGVLYLINAAGLRPGRTMQESSSLIKTAMLVVFIAAALAVFAPAAGNGTANLHEAGTALGWAVVINAYSLIRGAYSGYDAPVYFSEENTEPSRSVPLALLLGLVLAFALYVGVNGALIYVLGVKGVAATPLPFNSVLDRLGGPLPGVIFALGAMIAVAGVANSGIMTAPRILFALGRDGLLPRWFTSVNVGGSPYAAVLLTGVCSLALAASGSFAVVFGLIALLDTVGYVLVDAAYFALRRKEPALARPFRAYFHPVAPALLFVIDLVLLVLFSGANRLALYFAVGLTALCVPLAMLARRARRA